jgi:hypothetical protein
MLQEENNAFKKNNIVLCSLFNKEIHGPSDNPLNSILSKHYLNIYKFNFNSLIRDEIGEEPIICEDFNYINDISKSNNRYFKVMKRNYPEYYHEITKHPSIRNYKSIVEKKNFLQLEIAECILLEDYLICIIKTFWIKLIQRSWKKVFQIRKRILTLRQCYFSLSYREKYGKWPKEYLYLPGLNGLLSKRFYKI